MSVVGQPEAEDLGSPARLAAFRCRLMEGTPVVNFTGGTKLMSIGAFSAALTRLAQEQKTAGPSQGEMQL